MKKFVLSVIAVLVAMFSANALEYVVEVPEGTKEVYICGAMTEWSHVEMTKLDDLIFTITIDGATEADNYKYCSGPAWSYVEKDANGGEVSDRVWQMSDVVETWALLYDPVEPRNVTLTVTVPEGTFEVYVNGTMNGWSGFDQLTKVTETQYTITYQGITDAEIQYKYASGPAWEFEEVTAEGEALGNRKSEEDNINDVVAMWKEIYETGIAEITAEKGEPVDFDVFSISGVQLPKDAKGVLIVRYLFEDGSSYSVKEIR